MSYDEVDSGVVRIGECAHATRGAGSLLPRLLPAVLAALGLFVLVPGVSGSPRAGESTRGTIRQADSEQVAGSDDCTSDTTLCLSQGRFLVAATWTKADGESGSAHAVNLTADSGYFWFFDPANIEVTVKTLDGCSVNDHYWFFSAGLTNLRIALTVTDTTTNTTNIYLNPQASAFQPIADTTAFRSCSVAAQLLSADPEEAPEDAAAAIPVLVPSVARHDSNPGCIGGDTALCFVGRFRVEADWQSASGRSGHAKAVALTSEAGYFTFFDPSNVELVVKLLDACSIGRGQWFFAAGMTTVGVQMTVTDTLTNEIRRYVNPLGTAFPPIQDTAAFSFCPTGEPPLGLSGTWTGTISFAIWHGFPPSMSPAACVDSASFTVDLVESGGNLSGQFTISCGTFTLHGLHQGASISGFLDGPDGSARISVGQVSANRINFQTSVDDHYDDDVAGGVPDADDILVGRIDLSRP